MSDPEKGLDLGNKTEAKIHRELSTEQDEYTKEDVEHWQAGAKQFKLFWEQLSPEITAALPKDMLGNLQAIF